ncbi:hypothetical protein ONE56_04060 [Vibrio mytili]|uniref:hypothetical protein n=1 Tax=Vibrio mytili TaxID=50718 RepID=UPI003C70215A
MLKAIQSLFQSKPRPSPAATKSNVQSDTVSAQEIEESILKLETALHQDESNFDTQKKLMVEYNKALKIFAKTQGYQHKVDELFIKIDELRNTTRKNF